MNLRLDLQPKQADLLALLESRQPDCATFLGDGGSRGSAKSYAARACAIGLAIQYPGVVIYLIRRVLKDLVENHVEKIALEFPDVDAIYNQTEHQYDFSKVPKLNNSSRIVMIYAETAADVKRISYGPECTFLLIDQAEQFTEEELTSFRICNRYSPPASRIIPKTCLFFNIGIGGVGEPYLRRIFHKRDFRPYKSLDSPGERPGDYKFIQMYGWDNYEWFRGQIDQQPEEFYRLSSAERFQMFVTRTAYGRQMNALPKHRREGELLGNFDAFSGQYFSDVWGDHVILEPALVKEIVQPWWVRWMGQDWGFGDHDYHCWMVTGKVSPSKWLEYFGVETPWPIDIVILYRENLVCGRAEMDLANDIVSMTPAEERPYLRDFYLSQDAFGQKAKQAGANSVGQAFADVMRRHGMPQPAPADQDRVNGWRFMYNCLRQASMRTMVVDKERTRQGPAFFINADCPIAIENIPLAVRDEDDLNDVMRVPGVIWEDVTDGIRYALKSKLDPRKTAPVSVQRQEAFNKAGPDPFSQAMAMRHFEEKQKRRHSARPGWRDAGF